MTDQREPRLPVLTGRAWTFTDDLAAADILPSRFAALSSPDAARQLFVDLDPTLAARFGAGDVLVAGQNLGRGPGGAAAARALAAAGVIAVVAGGPAPRLSGAGVAAGLVPPGVEAPGLLLTAAPLRL